MAKELKVYVINASDCNMFNDWERVGDYEAIMSKAEELGSVYSLQGFQDAINTEELNLVNSWIYII